MCRLLPERQRCSAWLVARFERLAGLCDTGLPTAHRGAVLRAGRQARPARRCVVVCGDVGVGGPAALALPVLCGPVSGRMVGRRELGGSPVFVADPGY